ncbi:GNAT family acetyltransferase [Methylobacterium planeticum]|uniref:GNAT family acetyltransferase n=1 Tax=Methylobacterium planeticum TaxID=2615211 RepID=A0A6N6MJI2_9HYPH|nr:GNAT family acetyltransferase [Methylobacterium planeticum]KAB1070651.1 GNAT family acetyltransferase [Methylobacterium planeticum]
MDDAVIRPMRDGEAAAVVALWHAAGVSRPWNDPETDLAFARRSPHARVLVAARGDRIVATAMVGEDGHRGWVYYLAVDPECQGGGLGGAMMEAAETWLRGRGVWKVQLLVRADNAAVRHFYEHRGYRDTRTVCFQKIIGEAGA